MVVYADKPNLCTGSANLCPQNANKNLICDHKIPMNGNLLSQNT